MGGHDDDDENDDSPSWSRPPVTPPPLLTTPKPLLDDDDDDEDDDDAMISVRSCQTISAMDVRNVSSSPVDRRSVTAPRRRHHRGIIIQLLAIAFVIHRSFSL
jgi:hypothetical protein